MPVPPHSCGTATRSRHQAAETRSKVAKASRAAELPGIVARVVHMAWSGEVSSVMTAPATLRGWWRESNDICGRTEARAPAAHTGQLHGVLARPVGGTDVLQFAGAEADRALRALKPRSERMTSYVEP